MRARVSWTIVLAVFLPFPPFRRERVEEMGFGEVFRMERMRVDPALIQALRSRWDVEATAFIFPWGHMIPSLEDVSRITGLSVYGRPESLGLFDVGKGAGESEDEHLDRLVRVSRRELASELEVQADLDLGRFLVLFLGRLLFATRGDTVHCHFLPLLEDLSEIRGYAWGVAFLAHQFDSLGASERQTSTSGFFPFLQVWAYLHLLALGRGDLTRSGLVPIARRWDARRDSRSLGDQLERLQEAIDIYPHLDMSTLTFPFWWFGSHIWGRAMSGSPGWCRPAPTLVGRCGCMHSTWCYLFTYSSASDHSAFGRVPWSSLPGWSFRGLHDTTDWHERAKEQINNLEHRGKAVRSDATTNDAYLQTYALKYGGKVYKSARHHVDVAGEIASLRALLYSAMQDREAAQRQTKELRRELSITSGGSAGRSGVEGRERREAPGGADQLRIRAEAAEARVAEVTREVEALRVRGPSADQAELTQLRADLQAQQAVSQSLQEIVTAIGRSHIRSRSRASVSRATCASVGQYVAGSSSRWWNEEEDRRRRGETSAQSGKGGGEMPPPPDRQEGSGESGGGQ
ncbi:hypothetical protein Taro_018166 [Colocasia esculenta]|uniref:Aminotransferase-like plant mobile domain-containing protein n=1 Tax=Colocasia esculenta TaxID=4460 RepID=A0A843UQP2_COLES|nr:hypothetical protein [Colocasia esculenta]